MTATWRIDDKRRVARHINVVTAWYDKVKTTKDLKPLRQESWFKDVEDFLNWFEVTKHTHFDIEVKYAVAELIEQIPETGPFKAQRLDIYRRLLYFVS